MHSNIFSVKKFEGRNFAKLSGDNNTIHINKIAGYNSIYGYNIVHGILIILKFFRKIQLKKNYSHIKIIFFKGFKYNSEIKIIKIKINKFKIFYELIQQKNVYANIEINFLEEKNKIQNLKKTTFKKNYIISKKIIKKFPNRFFPTELKIALCYLTKYVGTVYPGKNSLINEINIYNNYKKIQKYISINSSHLDKRFPIIYNRLIYKNYNIEFKTIIRPELNITFNKPNKKILKEINSITENVLIIGGSSGIGNDLLKLFLNNKKIKIISTYFKNKINIKRKNLIIKKLDIENNLKVVFNFIEKYSPIIIYYFPTPKILNKTNDNQLIKLYKQYYIYYPIKIIKFSNKFRAKFFYPSTTFIENKILSPYASIKLQAEKKIKRLKDLKVKINILRIPEINTKQNLSLVNRNLKNFRDLISKNKSMLNKVVFKYP